VYCANEIVGIVRASFSSIMQDARAYLVLSKHGPMIAQQGLICGEEENSVSLHLGAKVTHHLSQDSMNITLMMCLTLRWSLCSPIHSVCHAKNIILNQLTPSKIPFYYNYYFTPTNCNIANLEAISRIFRSPHTIVLEVSCSLREVLVPDNRVDSQQAESATVSIRLVFTSSGLRQPAYFGEAGIPSTVSSYRQIITPNAWW